MFGELCRALALRVARDFDPDLVVGIARAGVFPGAVVARSFERTSTPSPSPDGRGGSWSGTGPRFFRPLPSSARGRRSSWWMRSPLPGRRSGWAWPPSGTGVQPRSEQPPASPARRVPARLRRPSDRRHHHFPLGPEDLRRRGSGGEPPVRRGGGRIREPELPGPQ